MPIDLFIKIICFSLSCVSTNMFLVGQRLDVTDRKQSDLQQFLIYSFVSQNRGLTKRKLAVFPLNIAEYASLESCR